MKIYTRSTIKLIIVALYIITWLFGVPSIQNSITSSVIDQYKVGLDLYPKLVEKSHPYLKTNAAFPLLPFVVITAHEYEAVARSGWGGLDFHLWYGLGSVRLFKITIWIS